MTIFNLGSINIDNFYDVPHMPSPGETLAATTHKIGLGGKGANQSVAAGRAGAKVFHIGAIGPDGGWCKDRLEDRGVDTRYVVEVDIATGHANICIDADGENMILLFPGANAALTEQQIEAALIGATSSDALILQNETNLSFEAAQAAKSKGMRVIYSAAPFDPEAVKRMLPVTDLLVVNEVEAEQLSIALGVAAKRLDIPELLITKGSKGAVWRDLSNDIRLDVSAFDVDPVDTTGAGDCYIGYFVAGLDLGEDVETALRHASAASALQVTRSGTADVMPTRDEVESFLKSIP